MRDKTLTVRPHPPQRVADQEWSCGSEVRRSRGHPGFSCSSVHDPASVPAFQGLRRGKDEGTDEDGRADG